MLYEQHLEASKLPWMRQRSEGADAYLLEHILPRVERAGGGRGRLVMSMSLRQAFYAIYSCLEAVSQLFLQANHHKIHPK